jgi:hypothetical protein
MIFQTSLASKAANSIHPGNVSILVSVPVSPTIKEVFSCSFQRYLKTEFAMMKGGKLVAINIKDLPLDLQRKVGRKAKLRMTQEEVKRHALAVSALLLDERNLTAKDARRVFTKALSLLR